MLSVIAVVAAAGVILSRRPVYSALFLLLNFAALAAFYVMLQAQFLAAVQVIVYAGAIVVLFLFVVMLIGGGELTDIRQPGASLAARFPLRRIVALVLALLLVVGLGYGFVTGHLYPVQGDAQAFGQGSVQAIGRCAVHRLPAPLRADFGPAAGGHDRRGGAGTKLETIEHGSDLILS